MKLWTPAAIVRETLAMNRQLDGGWVTITAHPVFGHGRWVIRLERSGPGVEDLTLGSDFDLSRAVRQAWAEIDRINERPKADEALLKAVESRRADPDFMDRLRARIEEDRPVLDRLAEHD